MARSLGLMFNHPCRHRKVLFTDAGLFPQRRRKTWMYPPHRLLLHQLVARLLGKCLKVAHRVEVVGGQHLEQFAALHGSQAFLALRDGQGAVQAPGIDFFVGLHVVNFAAGCPAPGGVRHFPLP